MSTTGYTDSGDQQPVGCRCSPDIEAQDCARLHPAIRRYAHPEDDEEEVDGLVDPAMDTCQECGRCLYLLRGALICQGCMEPYGECECEPLEGGSYDEARYAEGMQGVAESEGTL